MFTDIMVDIESTGTNPDRHAIIQIAAVKFNPETREVDPAVFNRCLFIPPWRSWDEDTKHWWGKQMDVLRRIQSRMEDPNVVMNDFQTWVGPSQDQPYRMWAKPIHFEFPFLSSYFKDFQVYNPFHYRVARDCRSYMDGLHRKTPGNFIEEKNIPFEGDAHDALFDVFHQIKWVFANLEKADA